MRTGINYLLGALLIVTLVSCMGQEDLLNASAGRVSVEFSPYSSEAALRSAMVEDDVHIYNYNLFLYRQGRLEWHLYQGTSDPVTVQLLDAETYSVYAVANIGRLVDAPDVEQDVAGMTFESANVSAAGAAGLPMASQSGMTIVVSDGAEVEINMARLAARYSFMVDRSGLQHGSFEVTSVRLKQAANTVGIFSGGCRATSGTMVSDGDYASPGDLESVNIGGRINLYMLENMQGTLLPGNTDPWMKEYFNPGLSDRKALCTYLEVRGRYRDRSGGLETENTYRMYLGSDAMTNFDVQRNASYVLTLTISDMGAYRESWKVDREELSDIRSLRFEPGLVAVPSLSSASVTLVASPSGTEFELEWNQNEWASASLTTPEVSGNLVVVSNTSALEENVDVLLRARTFDGLKSAVCTLRVLAPELVNIQAEWAGEAPRYVAQAGVVHCSDVPADAVLSAVSSDPSIVRLVRTGNDFRVEAVKEGQTDITVSMQRGTAVSSKTFSLDILPVYLQIAGRSYEAFADGGANAVRIDVLDGSTWRISYDVERSAFDDALYEELLDPVFNVTREGSSGSVSWFSIDESSLYVSGWGGDISNVLGRFTLTASPRADIYSGTAHPVSALVVVNAPFSGLSSLAFDGENRYYMPDPGEGCELSAAAANVVFSLGDSSNFRICLTDRAYRYGEGTSFVACQYEYDAQTAEFRVSASYDSVLAAYPSGCHMFRGNAFRVYASVSNCLSGESSSVQLGTATVHLGLAVCTRLERWTVEPECDEDGDYFLIPCLYWERLESGLVTLYSSGDIGSDPFNLPQNVLTGMPWKIDLYGSDIDLVEYYPTPGRVYSSYQLHDRTLGSRDCFNLTRYAYYALDFDEQLFDSGTYDGLEEYVGTWIDIKCGWHLYDPFSKTVIPDGGSFDIDTRGDVKCFLRIHDCARSIDEEYFED